MASPLSLPTIRSDRFNLEGRFFGGQGGVHLAFDRVLRRQVVLRLLDHHQLAHAAAPFLLRRRLQHPGVASALDVVLCDGETWLVEEHIAGTRWDEAPPNDMDAWWQAARGALCALLAVHEHGIVHRDLKAENLIFRTGGVGQRTPVLIDFGLAVRSGTRVGPGGTLGTAAPEIFDGGRADARADLFGAGALLLAATLGITPAPQWSLEAGAIERDLAEAPLAFQPLLEALCASDPERRIASAEEALKFIPPSMRTRPLYAPAEWPLVGRDALLDQLNKLGARQSDHASWILIDGASGIGKHRLASAIACELRLNRGQRDLAVVELGTMPSAGSSDLAQWLRHRNAAEHAIGVLHHSADAAAYTAALPPYALEIIEVPPLSETEIATLLRRIDSTLGHDARLLHEQSAGIPAKLALQLAPAVDTTTLDAEARQIAATLMLCDSRVPWPDEVALRDAASRAIAAGHIETTRDGYLRVAQSWRSAAYLADQELATRRAAWQATLAAITSSSPFEAEDQAWHALLVCCAEVATHDAEQVAQACQRFAQHTERNTTLERRVHLLALTAQGGVLSRMLPHLVPALRRLLGEGRTTGVDALLATWDAETSDALVRALRGRAAFERGDLRSALDHLRASAIQRLGDLDLQHDLLRALQAAGHWNEVLSCVETLRSRGLARTPEERGVLAQAEALALYRTARADDAVRILRDSLAELDASTPHRLRLLALQNLGLIERYRGALDSAEAAFAEAAEGFLRLGDPRSATLVDINRAVLLQDAGQPARAQQVAAQAAQRAKGLGVLALERIASATSAIARARLHGSPSAVAALRQAEHELKAIGLERESMLLKARRLAAEIDLEGRDTSKAGEWQALLSTEAVKQHPQAAAIAAAAWIEDGEVSTEDLDLVRRSLRNLLRHADRSSADRLRYAWDRGRCSAADAERRGTRLERLAQCALPSLAPLAFAAAARCGGAFAPRRAAQALRAARRIAMPRSSIEAWLAAAACALAPPRQRALRRAPRELSLLFHALREEGSELQMNPTSELQRYAAELAALEQSAAELAREPSGGDAAWRTLARLNALLLDERVTDETKYAQILEAAVRTTGAARGFLLVRDLKQQERIVARHSSDLEEADDELRLELSRSVLTRVLETGTAVRTVDAMADPEFRYALSVAKFHLSSIACVPLRAGSRILGALYLDHPHERSAFGPEVMERLATLADQASLSLSAARQREQIERLNADLKRDLSEARAAVTMARGATTVVHQSAVMRELLARVQRIAVSELPALVRGETGTGKELIARRLHELSPRRDGPFVSENCSALPSELLESELFGHEKGAFTGALRDKPGLLRMAHGGTLFLDEIGDMPIELQTRLLRVLQEGRMRPVGADREQSVDVRLVTATHRDLEQMVREERFREDLYYRIRVAELTVPPLRERREDIPLLIDTFLTRDDARAALSAPALQVLMRYAWPGNVRELEGLLRSVLVLKRGAKIEVEDLPAEVRSGGSLQAGALPSLQLKELERLALIEALKQVDGNRARAADMLGISRSSVFNKLREHGLS